MDDAETKRMLLNNWNEEMEASYLYQRMAASETVARRKAIYQKLSDIEKSHASLWEEELKRFGIAPAFTLGIRARALNLFGNVFGHTALLDSLEQEEQASVASYAVQASRAKDKRISNKLKRMIHYENSHKRILDELGASGKASDNGKRWHKGSGPIRDFIFGISDGLLSTFSLITGVAGADPQNSFVVLAGLAGAVAGSTSMAAGAYISSKSEREMFDEHLQTQRLEMAADPRSEEAELSLFYQLKGIVQGKADKIAKRVMSDKSVGLGAMADEELGLSTGHVTDPFQEAMIAGGSFFLGALIPVLPWILLPGKIAFYTSIAVSMGSFFVIGAGRTLVTGKNPLKSGIEMFLIGSASAIVAYAIGSLIGVSV